MFKQLKNTIIICSLLPSLSFASWYAGGQIGVGKTQQGFDKTLIYNRPLAVTNRYQTTTTKNATLLYGVYVGKEVLQKERYHLGVAAEGNFIVHNDIRGLTTTDVTGVANNLRFNFAAKTYSLLLRGEVYHQLNKSFRLSGLVNLGLAINRLYYFNEQVVTPGAIIQRPFGANSQAQAAYGIGFGLDYTLSKRSQLSVGVRYLNNGKGQFRTSPDQVSGQRLTTKALETRLISVSYRFS